MKRFLLFFSLIILLINNNGYSQKAKQDFELATYNTFFGAFTSGIGAVINKDKNTNWKKAFIKGFWQGSIGGFINYTGKKTIFLINNNDNLLYAWPASILHYAGKSIMENAALNEPFLKNWHYEYGFFRFDFSVYGNSNFRIRLLPQTIVALLQAKRYGSFDLKSSILSGSIIYKNKELLKINVDDDEVFGVNFGRTIAIGKESYITKRVIAHELIHYFQFSEYQIFNTWLKPFAKKIKSKTVKTIFEKYVYLDLPYFSIPYALQGQHYNFKNFYEFEAEFFSTNTYVPR